MSLTRKSAAPKRSLASRWPAVAVKTMDRRTFLKRSGVTLGAGAFAAQLPFSMIGKAQAEAIPGQGKIEVKRTVCTHCSVGCAVDAVVQNGVWVGQEPVFDSPINLGSHCAKGAAVRDHGMTHDSRRLKYPMKLVNGKYQRISWDQALDGITQKMLAIRKESGPDAAYFVGSSKHGNEQAFLLRKFVSLWGTNNCDHQARICHSTTVAGVANTWGYGAMTNSYNDEHNSKALLFLGSNAAEAHPVSMLHTLHAKEQGAKIIVVDPRFTRTAAKADYFYRIRSGTDIAFLYGMLHHVFANGWEDKEYIASRVYGMDKVRDEAKKWTPQAVKDVTGMAEDDDLGDGADPAHDWQRRGARELHPAARAWQRRRVRRRHQYLPRSRQRAGRHRRRAQCRLAARLLRPLGRRLAALGSRLEYRLRLAEESLCEPGADGKVGYPGVALVRRRGRGQGQSRPAFERARDLLLGACAELADSRPGDEGGDGQARSPRGHRSVSLRNRSHGGHAERSERQVRAKSEPRGVPAARGDAVRVRGLVHGVEPLAAVARARDRAALRLARRPGHHVCLRAEVGLRRPAARQERRQAEHPPRQSEELRGAGSRGCPQERDQPRRLDDRLHRPDARAPTGAHAQHAPVRRQDPARAWRQGRQDRVRPHRGLLRPALAVLRHARAEAPGHAQPLRHVKERDGGRR